MKTFWIFWSIDALVALIFGYFFLIGIGDGTVSSFNIVLWLGILGSLAVVLGLGWFLRYRGYPVLALWLLGVLAVPAVGAGLFFLILIVSHPRWN